MSLRVRFLLLVFIVVLSGSCTKDAPRDNIFDPQSNLYENGGSILGEVTGKYPPYDPIPGLLVEVVQDQRFTYTNEEGEFEFSRLLPGKKNLRLSGDGFTTLQDSLEVGSGGTTEYLTVINGEPIIEGVDLLSRHIAHWQPLESEYILDVSALVADKDGSLDIDSVLLEIPEWSFSVFLTRGGEPNQFEGIYFNDSFEPFAFPEIQGVDVILTCQDKSGIWGPEFLTQVSRLIISTPATLTPAGLSVVDSLPVFRWLSFDAGFEVDYQVDIFRLDESAIPQFILSSPILTETNLQWQSSLALPAAQYYWTLTVVDRYGNISVSKEASFLIEGL